MKHIKKFNEIYEAENFNDAYSGPPIVAPLGGVVITKDNLADTLAAGGSDGMFGNSSAMGGEYPKKQGPTSSPKTTKYKPTIKKVKTKESKRRIKALKKLMRLDKPKLKNFNEYQKENK